MYWTVSLNKFWNYSDVIYRKSHYFMPEGSVSLIPAGITWPQQGHARDEGSIHPFEGWTWMRVRQRRWLSSGQSLMTLICYEWHLFLKWLLRSIFAQFPEHASSKGLVSWENLGKYSMIDRDLEEMLLGDYPARIGVHTVMQFGARLPMYTLNYWTVQVFNAQCKFFNCMQEVCLNVTLHTIDLWQYDVCCIRLGVTRCMHPLYGALPVTCQCWLFTVS